MLVTEESRRLMLRVMAEIDTTDRRQNRYEGVRKDGSRFPLLVRSVTHINAAGEPEGSAGFVTDLTDIVAAQRAIEASERDLRGILDNMQDTYYRTDLNGVLVRASCSAEQLLGYRPEEVIGMRLADLYCNSAEREKLLALLATNGGAVTHFEGKLRHRSGREVWVSTHAHYYRDEHGRIAGVEGIARDITAWRDAREQLRLAAKVFEGVTEGVAITDAQFEVISVNPSFVEMTGHDAAHAIGCRLGDFATDPGGQALAPERMLNERGAWSGEVWCRRRDGAGFPSWLSVSVVRDDAGNVSHHVALFSDITERKAHLQRVEFLAHHDPLTELPNRLLFRDRVEQAIARAARTQSTLALLFVDLDDFKLVNDSFGHAVGDQVLREVGKRIAAGVRETDTVGRYGGDEFVIVVTGLSDVGTVGLIQQKIAQLIMAPVTVEGRVIHVRCSIGAAVYPLDGRDYESLLRHADAAMYSAKGAPANVLPFHAGIKPR
jgi:diguanylate cyclase (GGDEF)-like protein/PAS domain S-box-containing protein